MTIDFGPAATQPELDALGDHLSHAFGFPPKDYVAWFERAKPENVRVVRHGARVVAGLLEIPMGQFFGGRSVSTMGVAGVGVAPAERGRNIAARMMIAMLREAKARGFALSTLYPASLTLYRRAGYERAGARFVVTLDPRSVELPRVPAVTIAEVEPPPFLPPDEIVALYTKLARRSHGFLDRGPYVWSRVTTPRGLSPKLFTVSHDGVLEGYLAVAHVGGSMDPSKVTVTDLAATTPRAANAILRMLVEYRSLAGSVQWGGGPSDLFMSLLPERHGSVELESSWMIRVLDVARAMEARGWPAEGRGTILFELTDASMPENSGRYAVTLAGGRARVAVDGSAGQDARVTLTERGLAALYTGYVAPHVLAELGWLEADEEGIARLEAWFAGPLPTLRDHF
jgi:predicted acetyltransferase